MDVYIHLPPEWSKGLERLIWLKYYNVHKWQMTFILGWNTTKNTDYMKKRFKCLELNSLQ